MPTPSQQLSHIEVDSADVFTALVSLDTSNAADCDAYLLKGGAISWLNWLPISFVLL